MSNSVICQWEKFHLNHFLKNVIDYRGKTPPKSKHGIPVISGEIDVENLEINTGEIAA